MKIEQAVSPNNIRGLLGRLLGRFHVIIYTVIAIGGIAVVIFILYQTASWALTVPSPDNATTSSFDQSTINKLESLSEKSSDSKPLQLPKNERTNPFIE
jgi:hypothetical protein